MFKVTLLFKLSVNSYDNTLQYTHIHSHTNYLNLTSSDFG